VAFDGDVDDMPRDMSVMHPDPLRDLTRAEGIEELRRAVSSLPLPYREAVIACDLQNSATRMPHGARLRVGTVRSRLHRGRALLASKLGATTGKSKTAEAGSELPRPRLIAI